MMLQNETEMYNLGLGGNARYCNGHVQVAAGKATKKECNSKKGKMVPSKDVLPSPNSAADGRLKFSDRLKALLKSGASSTGTGTGTTAALVKDESVDQPDDPYTFSEPEPQVIRLYQNQNPNHTYSRHSVTLTSKQRQPSGCPKSGMKVVSPPPSSGSDVNVGKLYPNLSASLGQLFSCDSVGLDSCATPQIQPKNIVMSRGEKVSDDESSKTMNRLQAKIARNKVIGKHKKVRKSSRSPDASPHNTPLVTNTSTGVGKNGSSARNLWPLQRERSLLEEQLLGLKTEVLLKKESASPPSLASRHAITYRPQMINHSSHAVMATIPGKRRRAKVISRQNEVPRHEALQRIQTVQQALTEYRQDLYPLGVEVSESEESDSEETPVYQRHWFSALMESGLACERESRLGQMRAELRRKVIQILRGMPLPPLGPRGRNQHSNVLLEALLDSARRHPSQAALFVRSSQHGKSCHSHMRNNRSKLTMLVKRKCSYRQGEADACCSLALPCTQHCVRHIMYNVDQLLFEHCTAKFSDNTQCCVPVFDICHELPLCLEHARKRDNYDRMCAETKPKKVRKKAKPSAMTRPSKRGKKKRRLQRPPEPPPTGLLDVQAEQQDPCEMGVGATASPAEVVEHYVKQEVVDNLVTGQDLQPEPIKEEHQSIGQQQQQQQQQQEVAVEVEEEVLAMAEELPLDTADLANQASRLLEEHDLTNVLNQIPADAFNDLFTDKNGEYEPTREETEELERALEAVDKDVKSLEKLSQTQGLLVDTLMDEHTLVHTLAQLPTDMPSVIPGVPGIVPVFTTYHHHHHNGYVVNSPHTGAIMAPITHHPLIEAPTISIQTQTDMPS